MQLERSFKSTILRSFYSSVAYHLFVLRVCFNYQMSTNVWLITGDATQTPCVTTLVEASIVRASLGTLDVTTLVEASVVRARLGTLVTEFLVLVKWISING